jgi:hypothetical protein
VDGKNDYLLAQAVAAHEDFAKKAQSAPLLK